MEKKIKAARMSKEAEAKVMGELKKLKMMSPMSAEATVVRNYIDTLARVAVAQEKQDQQGSRATPSGSWTRTITASRRSRNESSSTWPSSSAWTS